MAIVGLVMSLPITALYLHLHVSVMDSHSTKYGKSLHKIFIIFSKRQTIKFIDQLQ